MSAEESYLVLSALGPDRPGLVAEITRYLAERGARVEDSRMAVLGTEFAVMLLVGSAKDKLARVTADTAQLEHATGMAVLTRPTRKPARAAEGARPSFTVSAEALDREGTAHAVAHALHKLDANIASLQTAAYYAAEGAQLFRLEARVELPRGVGEAQLRATLDSVGRNEGIDLVVAPAE